MSAISPRGLSQGITRSIPNHHARAGTLLGLSNTDPLSSCCSFPPAFHSLPSTNLSPVPCPSSPCCSKHIQLYILLCILHAMPLVSSFLDSKLIDAVIKLHISIHMSPYFPKIKKSNQWKFYYLKKERVLKTQPIISKLAMSLAPRLEWRFTANKVLSSAHKPQ